MMPNLSYKTGMSSHDAFGGVDSKVLSHLQRPVTASRPTGTAGLAASQMGRSQGLNNAANARHAMAGIRADQDMDQQARRSEASVAGLNMGSEQFKDQIQRGIAQRGLATDVFSNNLGFGAGLATTQIRAMQQLMQQMRSYMRTGAQEME